MTFAIIEAGGKQYLVKPGQKLRLDAAPKAAEKVVFDRVLLVSKEGVVEVGAPYVAGAKVEASVAKAGRGAKTVVFKYHSKTRYRKKAGHRQRYLEVEITSIS